ncbi:MAG: Lrp/AsnC family transcriptional regulator, partial [Deltaproteobacteria bacterium]|nr:Lrp/AsnC family transcriptional regulator [Deltaproteobacteria bacterium]
MIKTDARYIELIRALQTEGLFLTRDPFGKIAELLGWETDEVIELTKALKEAGIIRRFGAALTPRNSGFKSNSMVVWNAGGGEEAGRIMAQHPRISHCYLRPSFEGFPYDLYTMIHADDPEHLERII